MKDKLLSSIISQIFIERSFEIIKDTKVFCSMLDDLAPDFKTECMVIRRVLVPNPEIASKIYSLLNTNDYEMSEAEKLRFLMCNNYGITDEWISIVFNAFELRGLITNEVTEEDNSEALMSNKLVIGSAIDVTIYNSFCKHKIATGAFHVLAVCENGKVLAAGDNRAGQCEVSNWTDIVAVAADAFHSVGLKNDGTVVATKINDANRRFDMGQSNVSGWRNIIAIEASNGCTFGLRSDGTVLATGGNRVGQCNVQSWKDIREISANGVLTMGLDSLGNVYCTGGNSFNQCSARGWSNISGICSGAKQALGIRKDNTVIATKCIGEGYNGQCDVALFSSIVQLSSNAYHTVGLKKDGTVVSTKYLGDKKYDYGQWDVNAWHHIVAISASGTLTVGLKTDGTLLAIGDNHYGQCNVIGWRLFTDIEECADFSGNYEKNKEYERLFEEASDLINKRIELEHTVGVKWFSPSRKKQIGEINRRLIDINSAMKDLGFSGLPSFNKKG